MNNNNYEKFSTKYNKLANFFVYRTHSDKVFEKLLTTNKISLSNDTYSMKQKNNYNWDNEKDKDDTQDRIYIRALYQSEDNGDVKLLVSNDARRKITYLYKERLEEARFGEKLQNKIRSKFGIGYKNDVNFAKFMVLLRSERCFTAGSFPLQIFLDEDWSGSDLDIFILSNGQEQSSLRLLLKSIASSEKKLSKDKGNTRRESSYELFNEVWEYTLSSGFRIQIIEVTNSSMDRILKNFDFDFCKIAWSFSSMISWKQLVITPQIRRAIETRTSDFDINLPNKHKCAERLAKYEARGFTVTNAKEMLQYEQTRKSESPKSQPHTILVEDF